MQTPIFRGYITKKSVESNDSTLFCWYTLRTHIRTFLRFHSFPESDRFRMLASGSLKKVAGLYGVTYPTVRLRLDRLIQKIHLSEDTAADPYVALVKRLAVADKLDFDTAKLLIQSYKKTKGEDA